MYNTKILKTTKLNVYLIIEINVVFARYEQATIDGFSLDFAAIAEKRKLEVNATSPSVKEK